MICSADAEISRSGDLFASLALPLAPQRFPRSPAKPRTTSGWILVLQVKRKPVTVRTGASGVEIS